MIPCSDCSVVSVWLDVFQVFLIVSGSRHALKVAAVCGGLHRGA